MASLSDRTALLIVANAFKYAMGFVLPMILARLLSQGEYGTYQQLMLLANAAAGIMVLGVPTSIYYFYHRNDRPTLIAQTQIILVASGAAAGLAIALAAPALAARMHNPQLAELLPRFALYVGLFIAGDHFLHVMISQDRYRAAVGLELAETLFRVAGIAALLALGYGLPAIVAMLIAYAGLRLIGRSFWLWTGPDSILKAAWRVRFPAAQLAYSLPLAASTCVGLVGGLLDKAIVALSFSPAAYAIYSIGALEIPLDSIFQGSVASVLRATLPALIAEGRLEEVARIWRDSVRKLALIMIPSFLFLTVFADTLITTLFTRRYQASVQVFHIYLLVLPLDMFILNAIPQVFGRTRLNLYVAAATVTSNVVLSFALLRIIGILGPATAFACSAYLGSALYFAVTTRLLRTRPLRLLPVAAIGRTLLAAGVAIAPATMAASLSRGLPSLLAAAFAFLAFYLVAGYVVHAFVPSDIEIARSWLRRLVPAAT
jgi:O-antigen/teichoic acid export membrane protein